MAKINNKIALSLLGWTLAGINTSALAIDEIPDGLTNVPVSDSLMDTVTAALPEHTTVSPEFLNPGFDPYLSLNQSANVSVTFLSEGAGFRNSLGYFTFDNSSFDGLSKSDIDTDSSGIVSLSELDAVDGVDFGWIFPNSSADGSGGMLTTGDTFQLTEGSPWAAGTNVSFFLGQNTWTKEGDLVAGLEDSNREVMYGLDFLNPEATETATVLASDASSRHVGMMFADDTQTDVIMGFEDLNRIKLRRNGELVSDEDFNDAVFLVTSDPAGAFGDSNIVTAPIPLMGSHPVSMVFALLLLGWGITGGKLKYRKYKHPFPLKPTMLNCTEI